MQGLSQNSGEHGFIEERARRKFESDRRRRQRMVLEESFRHDERRCMPNFGRWSELGLPHAGWQYVDIYSLKPNERQLCGMCQTMKIRHIHVMEHPDADGFVEAGAVCAARMAEEHVDEAKARERRLKSGASKRWQLAKNGSPYLKLRKADGALAFVNRHGLRWSVTIKRRSGPPLYRTPPRFRSEFAAKLAAEVEGARLVAAGVL